MELQGLDGIGGESIIYITIWKEVWERTEIKKLLKLLEDCLRIHRRNAEKMKIQENY